MYRIEAPVEKPDEIVENPTEPEDYGTTDTDGWA